MNNHDSLRKQIISAMGSEGDCSECGACDVTRMFDNAIMPVLDAAMKAGELLLHRATTTQPPVSQAILDWVERVCLTIAQLHHQEATVSKRELVKALYTFEDSANKALADARAIRTQETTEEAMGRLLGGNSILPAKG